MYTQDEHGVPSIRAGVAVFCACALVSVASSLLLVETVDRWVTGGALLVAGVVLAISRPLLPQPGAWRIAKILVAGGAIASGLSSLLFGF